MGGIAGHRYECSVLSHSSADSQGDPRTPTLESTKLGKGPMYDAERSLDERARRQLHRPASPVPSVRHIRVPSRTTP